MSYSRMYGVPESGEIVGVKDYRNGWAIAPVIWNYLWRKYIRLEGSDQYVAGYSFTSPGVGMKSNWEFVWALSDDNSKLEPWEALCLALTFDKLVLRKENFKIVSLALYRMAEATYNPNEVNNILDIADDLIDDSLWEGYIGACFMWTSVADDVWHRPYDDREDDENGEPIDGRWLWDISKDEGHWFMFDEFEEFATYEVTFPFKWKLGELK